MTLETNSNTTDSNSTSMKFLYSYNGKIIPRPTDAQLRYSGGVTRVLSVDRSISFAELMIKFGELCGCSMSLKIKLPYEDLDLLVTIRNDEELGSAMNEYSLNSKATGKDMKMRAILVPHQKISPPPRKLIARGTPVVGVQTRAWHSVRKWNQWL